MRRLAALLTVVVLAAACGSSDPDSRSLRRSPTPSGQTAEPGTTPPAGADDEPSDREGTNGRDGEPNPGGSGPDGGSDTPTPRPTAPPDVVLLPQAERYEYTVTGTRQTPAMDASEAYPDGARLIWEHETTVPVQSWVEITYKGSLDADDARFEHTIAWRRAGLRHVSWQTRLPGPRLYSCRFEPRIAYANAPMKPETYPTQEWVGPTCSGTSDFRVVEQTEVTDANGTRWEDVWRVEEKTTYQMQNATGTRTVVHWFSHDQGVDIRTDVLNEGTAGADPFRYEQRFLLAKRVMPERNNG